MKKYLVPFGAGMGLFVIACAVLLVAVSIWVSTVNVAGRTWYFAGKEYSSAEMRLISIELQQRRDERGLTYSCYNPETHFKGYSGVVVEGARGLERELADMNAAMASVDESVGTLNQLACLSVLPSSTHPMQDYVNTLITAPLVGMFTTFIDNSASE